MAHTILLIDDHPQVGVLVQLLLKKTSFRSVTLICASDMKEALTALNTLVPDVIFLDNYLGEFNGFEEPLKMVKAASEAPVVLFSGVTLDELGYTRLPKGASDFLSKMDLQADTLDALLTRVFQMKSSTRKAS